MSQPAFTDGVRDDTSLIIGIAGASGSGKTVSALLLAGEPLRARESDLMTRSLETLLDAGLPARPTPPEEDDR